MMWVAMSLWWKNSKGPISPLISLKNLDNKGTLLIVHSFPDLEF
jgi:hypothetical protein